MNGFAKIILNIRITVLFSLFIIMFCGNALGISADNLFSKEMKERKAAYDKIVSVKEDAERNQVILEMIKILKIKDIDKDFNRHCVSRDSAYLLTF